MQPQEEEAMEHRHHARMEMDVPMLIYRSGIPVAIGRIRDASRGGVFVQTGYAELRLNQQLEVEFCVSEADSVAALRVRAHVRRCDAGGIALEVDDRAAAVAPSMRCLLGQHRMINNGARSGPGAFALQSGSGPTLKELQSWI